VKEALQEWVEAQKKPLNYWTIRLNTLKNGVTAQRNKIDVCNYYMITLSKLIIKLLLI
jgi:hypothetical protein